MSDAVEGAVEPRVVEEPQVSARDVTTGGGAGQSRAADAGGEKARDDNGDKGGDKGGEKRGDKGGDRPKDKAGDTSSGTKAPDEEQDRKRDEQRSARNGANVADLASETLRAVRREFSVGRAERIWTGDHYTSVYTLPQQRARAVTVPVEEERLHEAHVPTDDEARVRDALVTARVVVLSGSDGCGKEALALHALTHRRTYGRILHLQRDLEDLDLALDEHARPGDAMVWADPPQASLQALAPFFVRRWCLACEIHDLRMVITTSADPQDLELLAAVVPIVEVSRSVDPWDVVVAHLRRRLAHDPDRANALVTREDLRALGVPALRSRPLRKAVQAAVQLARADDPAEALRSLLSDDVDAAWFKGLARPLKLWAVALAACNGLAAEYVGEAFSALEEVLEPDPWTRPVVAPAPDDPFSMQTSHMLKQVRGGASQETWTSDHGRVPAVVLRYDDVTAPQHVLEHVWREHAAMRGPVLEWQHQLGVHENALVRTRAASTAGLLARRSFEVVLSEVVQPWAGADDDRGHRSAATALVVAALDPTVEKLVDVVVEKWLHKDSDVPLRCAGSYYLGLTGGRLPVDQALKRLRSAAATSDWDVVLAVGTAVSDLVFDSSAPPGTLDDAVAAVDEWRRRDVKGDRRDSACVAAYMLLERVAPVGTSALSVRWPRLLDRVRADPDSLDPIARLWAWALVEPWRHSWFTAVLGAWARTAEKSPKALPPFLDVVERVAATSPRHAQLMGRHALRWSQRNGSSPATGVAVLDRLAVARVRTGAQP